MSNPLIVDILLATLLGSTVKLIVNQLIMAAPQGIKATEWECKMI